MKFLALLLILSMAVPNLYAESSHSSDEARAFDDARSNSQDENWKISAGAAYVNQITRRGLKVYGGDQFLPVLSMNLGSPRFFISGLTLNYKTTPFENLIVRYRLAANATSDEPLYKSQEDLQSRAHRTKTTEAEIFWEYRFLPFLEFTGNISQDLIAHGGTYAKAGFRWIVGNYFENLMEPAFFISQGFGNKPHNEYLYGAGAKEGSAVQYFGFSIACPKKVDAFYPVLEITKSWLNRDLVGSGVFVRADEIENTQFLIWGAVRVW